MPATITLKDDLIFATGNPINLNYTYNGNGQVTITWYEDKDTTQQLQEAPKGGRSYWIVMSAEATNLYQAVSKIEEVEVKKGGQPAEKPTVSQTKAGSITVKTISGQKYICTDSSNRPVLMILSGLMGLEWNINLMASIPISSIIYIPTLRETIIWINLHHI